MLQACWTNTRETQALQSGMAGVDETTPTPSTNSSSWRLTRDGFINYKRKIDLANVLSGVSTGSM